MGLPWYALISAGLVLGGVVGWYLWTRMKQAERERLELAGRKAADVGEHDADVASANAEEKANEAKKRAGSGW